MAEYIEREAAINAMCRLCSDTTRDKCSIQDICNHVCRLEAVPAADVRPVVLCRDCKYNMANIPDIQDGININENWNACQLTELYDSVKPDDFCSRGVKRGGS